MSNLEAARRARWRPYREVAEIRHAFDKRDLCSGTNARGLRKVIGQLEDTRGHPSNPTACSSRTSFTRDHGMSAEAEVERLSFRFEPVCVSWLRLRLL